MSEAFDPYHEWLGIPPEEQPPDHYRLLGIARFEHDGDVIAGAADRQMTYVRTFQTGRRTQQSQKLLNQLAAARLCLLDKNARTTYDGVLRAKLAAEMEQAAGPPPLKAGPPLPPPSPQAPPPIPPPREGRVTEPPMPGGGRVTEPPMAVGGRVSEPPMTGGQTSPMSAGATPVTEPPMAGGPSPSPVAPVAPSPSGTAPPKPTTPKQVTRPAPRGPAGTAPAAPMAHVGAGGPGAAPPAPPVGPKPPMMPTAPPVGGDSSAYASPAMAPATFAGVKDPTEETGPQARPFYRQPWFPIALFLGPIALAFLALGIGLSLSEPPEEEPDPPKKPPEVVQPPDDVDPPEPEVALIEQQTDGQVFFPAADAQIHGAAARVEDRGGKKVIANWTLARDWLSWEFNLKRPGIFRAEVTYATPAAAGGRYNLAVETAVRSTNVRSTGSETKFVTENVGHLTIRRSGRHTLTMKVLDKPGEQLMILQSIRLTPAPVGGNP